jgi:hypothetical protein
MHIEILCMPFLVGLFRKQFAAVLSQGIGIGFCGDAESERIFCTRIASSAVMLAATYSAAVIDLLTVGRLRLPHTTWVSSTVITMPGTDLQVTSQLAPLPSP